MYKGSDILFIACFSRISKRKTKENFVYFVFEEILQCRLIKSLEILERLDA